jgi:glycine C-acetyltransferase
MFDLEVQLKNANSCRNRIIVTDGVFSMDGTLAQLDKICELAKKYDAIVMSDECHSTGFIGKSGRGVHEELGVVEDVDIITGTLGKALGGASGGFTSGPKEVIEILRQKSRPYLFSNTLAPSIVGASLAVLDILESDNSFLNHLKNNTRIFRDGMERLGFDIKPGNHPIVPVMLYDDHLAQEMSSELLNMGIYVIGFFFPVVPKGEARIRVQLSASHSTQQVNQALKAFEKVGKKLGVIK